MIRRTLVNRAQRQLALARTLIARHSMIAHQHRRPQLGYRPAADRDDSWALAAAVEPAALALDQIAPSADELANLFAAWPESQPTDTPTLFDLAQPAAPAPGEQAVLEPVHTVPDAPELVSALTAASAQPSATNDQSAGKTLADLVRRMRAPDWVPPEALLPATTPQALMPAVPTANEQLSAMVHQMQKPPQRVQPKVERPRIPLGQRLSEAADFGQTPASPHQEYPTVRLPSEQSAPARELSAKIVELQPAPVFAEAAYSAAEVAAHTADSMIVLPAFPPQGDEQRPIVEHGDRAPEILIRVPAAVNADTPQIAPPIPSRDAAEATGTLPAVASGASSTQLANPVAPDAPLEDQRNAPQVQFQLPMQKDAGTTTALASSVASDLRAPAADSQQPGLAPPLPWQPTPITIGEGQAELPAPTTVGAGLRASEPTLAQSAESAPALAAPVLAAPAIRSLAPDRAAPVLVSEPSAPPSQEIDLPHEVVRDQLRRLAERGPAAVATTNPDRTAQTNAELTQWVESESQPAPAEADTLSMPAQPLGAFDIAEAQSTPSEPAQESQPVAMRQLESSLPQVQTPSLPAQSAQHIAFPSAPTSSASAELAADSQSRSGARSPNISRTSLPQEAVENAPIAAVRADQPIFAPVADPAQHASVPNAAQQPASDPSNHIGSQPDTHLPESESSVGLPSTEHDRVTPVHDHVPASAQHAPVTVLAEHAPTLSQPLHVPEANAAPASSDLAWSDEQESVTEATETPLAHSDDQEQQTNALSAASQPHQIAAERAPVASIPSPINQPSNAEPPSPVAISRISAVPEPGTPQAWAARLATHRQATEPQPEPTAAYTPTVRYVERAQGTPSEPHAIQPAPDQATAAIDNPTRRIPTRFVPAQRVGLGDALLAQDDTRPLTTNQSPVIEDVAAAASGARVAVAPAPSSPQAWAARLVAHRQATSPQPEPTIERTPVPRVGTESQPEPTVERTLATTVDAASTAPTLGSPQAWSARLFPQAQPASQQLPPNAGQQSVLPTEHQEMPAATLTTVQSLPPAHLHRAPTTQPQVALRRAVPTPTGETTRRFLQPLIGIDPAEVRVFRGSVAGQVTAAYQADALASGDTVALAAGHGEDSPATLGVLAHELTHIARQRDARFVPPLARRENISGATDEESLAQSVEAQVRRIARGQAEATWTAAAPSAAAARHDVQADAPIIAPAQPRPTEHGATIARMPQIAPDPQPSARGTDWGGLPAPWESLPEWLDAPTQAEISAPAVPEPARHAPPTRPTVATRHVSPSMPPVAPLVQLAKTGRMLDALPAQSAPAAIPAQQPAPDLDALARQVYAVLKQRLASERRRSQS